MSPYLPYRISRSHTWVPLLLRRQMSVCNVLVLDLRIKIGGRDRHLHRSFVTTNDKSCTREFRVNYECILWATLYWDFCFHLNNGSARCVHIRHADGLIDLKSNKLNLSVLVLRRSNYILFCCCCMVAECHIQIQFNACTHATNLNMHIAHVTYELPHISLLSYMHNVHGRKMPTVLFITLQDEVARDSITQRKEQNGFLCLYDIRWKMILLARDDRSPNFKLE